MKARASGVPLGFAGPQVPAALADFPIAGGKSNGEDGRGRIVAARRQTNWKGGSVLSRMSDDLLKPAAGSGTVFSPTTPPWRPAAPGPTGANPFFVISEPSTTGLERGFDAAFTAVAFPNSATKEFFDTNDRLPATDLVPPDSQIQPIPEPATLLLLGVGLIALAKIVMKRKK
ncbi:MAG: PEP-CTERM sorting domain-containing protein [Desulfobacterales bacterium]|nr:MAG: PEP-CTERM sorting domain-containing protein [Desulfobacterales bacterium]